MSTLIVSNCTQQKKVRPLKCLCAHTLPVAGLQELMAEWKRRIRAGDDADKMLPAREMYRGSGVAYLIAASELLRADVAFISAGLGFVSAEKKIPSYSLTFNEKARDNISRRGAEAPFNAREWWRALTRVSWEKELAAYTLVIFALPLSYFGIFADDLCRLRARTLSKVRIIGPQAQRYLPEELQPYWLPYDARFHNPAFPNRGSLVSFPQRALRHFAENVAHKRGVDAQRRLVNSILNSVPAYEFPRRRSLDDTEMLAEIGKCYKQFNGVPSRVYLHLREKRNVGGDWKRLKRLIAEYAEGQRQ